MKSRLPFALLVASGLVILTFALAVPRKESESVGSIATKPVRIRVLGLPGAGGLRDLTLSETGSLLTWTTAGEWNGLPLHLAPEEVRDLFRLAHEHGFADAEAGDGAGAGERNLGTPPPRDSVAETVIQVDRIPESRRAGWERLRARIEDVRMRAGETGRRVLLLGLDPELVAAPLRITLDGTCVGDWSPAVAGSGPAPPCLRLHLEPRPIEVRIRAAPTPDLLSLPETSLEAAFTVGAETPDFRWIDRTEAGLAVGPGSRPYAPGSEEHLRARRRHGLRMIAAGHVHLGELLDRAGMGRLAFREWRRSLRRDPDHEASRFRLGWQRGAEGWEPDPTALVDRMDRAEGEAAGDAIAEYEGKRGEHARHAHALLSSLADEARAAGASATGEELLWTALEYAPDDPATRDRLGFTGGAGLWLQPEDAERRDAFAQALERAASADASRQFEISGGSAIPEQAPLAMATREMFHRLFDLPLERELFPAPMKIEMLGSREEWAAFVETVFPEADREYARTKLGAWLQHEGGPRMVAATAHADDAWKKDLTVHDVAHALIHAYLGGDPPLWIQEGVACTFQFAFLGEAQVGCIPSAPTAENPAWDMASPRAWRGMLRESVLEQEAPPLSQVVGGGIESMSTAARIKTYSFVEYLLAERRAQFLDLLSRLRSGQEHDPAVLEAFDVDALADLDRAWEAWVLRRY